MRATRKVSRYHGPIMSLIVPSESLAIPLGVHSAAIRRTAVLPSRISPHHLGQLRVLQLHVGLVCYGAFRTFSLVSTLDVVSAVVIGKGLEQ